MALCATRDAHWNWLWVRPTPPSGCWLGFHALGIWRRLPNRRQMGVGPTLLSGC